MVQMGTARTRKDCQDFDVTIEQCSLRTRDSRELTVGYHENRSYCLKGWRATWYELWAND